MPMRIQVLALVLSLRLLASQEPGAGTDLERADGVRLSVRRDAESVRVLDGERAVARYGRAGGDLRLREGAVALSFHAEGAAPAGALRSLHAGFAPPRLADGGGTEAAAISERLRWLDASGRAVLDEQRTVTVLAPEAAGVTVLWESYLSPVLGAGPAALAAAGLRVSLDPSLAGGTFLAAGEAAPRPELRGVRAGWCAWRAAGSTGPAGPAGPLAVALHGPAAGQRRPLAGSGAAGPGPWLEASAAGDGPLLLRPGERLAVRLAIVVHEEAPDAARLEEGQARAARLLGDEAPALEPGLLARYGAARGKEAVEVRRIEPKLSHDWRGGMPDERLPAGPFRAEWAGRLLVTEDGEHRFVLAARGAAKALVDGALVAATEATPVTSSAAAGGAGPAAVATGTVTLEYGYHELEVEYDAPGEGAAISLSWAMRDGPADVIPARSLAHDAAAGAALDGDFAYERGRLLASRLGCEGCHGPTGGASSAAGPGSWTRAPPLTHAAWLQRGYIESLLAAPGDGRPRSLHPALRGDPARALEDSRALAAFLVAVSAPRPEPLSLPPGSAKRGGELFEAIGCAACHEARGAAGGSGLLEGDPMAPPRLAGTGDKWPTDALVRFLREPRAFRPRGLMPDLRLGEMEAVDIAAFLSSLGVGEPRGEPAPPDPALATRGRELFAERGCGACHEAPGAAPGSPGARAAALAAESFRDAGRGCLAGAASEERPQVPRYVLSAPDARVLAVRFGARPREPSRLAPAEAASRWVREELGCLRCHGRDGAGGAGTAPDLSGAGARLDPTWVRDALGGKAPVARPWLATRMPVFALEAGEVDAIAEALAAEDRGLEAARPAFAEPPPEPPAAELREAGLRLLGPDGLNCQSCHFIGPQRPLADTVGPDLALAAQRLERLWFERWLEEPRRFRPETPMPAFTTPVPGVFGGSIARQRAALWDFLAATPAQDIALAKAAERRLEPQGGPLFVQARVRGAGAVRADRGIALALPPAPSLLFDAGRLSWLGAWRGSFLRRAGQHGAHAWWEPASAPLGEDAARLPPVLFRSAGEPGTGLRGPALHRGRFGWFDGIAHESGGVRLRYRLRLAGGSFLRVEEALRAAEGGGRSRRLERDVTIAGVAGGEGSSGAGGVSPAMEIGPEVLVLALPELFGLVGAPAEADLLASGAPVSGAPVLRFARGALRADASGAAARWALLRGPASFPVVEPFTDEAIPPGAAFPPESAEAGGRIAVALRAEEALRGGPLRLSVELDGLVGEGAAAPATVPARAGPPPAALEARGGAVGGVALPEGYSIEALRLDPTFLPCAVAFLRGELLVAGYDGEVRRAADTNADGLQDSYLPFAGPFDQACSLLARGEELIVAAPGAAYAVRDRDGDAVADDYRTLSSAWDWAGHPFDWLFGFGAGSDGSLYGSNSTPHERGQVPGAWRRGAVIRIAPDGTTTEVAKGMRYEFGWTTDSGGRCYFTVNQGPWNVTCAIHELEVGAHYGFGEPDLSRVKAPVVRVPYPWCHALTGIVAAETGGRFGAFEGQGIAADYNTRRLIRWTVQDAGGTRQGACYPFVDGLEAGPTGLAFGPDGALYVAWMADGAWYPERPRGGVYRIAARGGAAPPFEVLEVRAARDGFEVRLTAPVDAATVAGSCRKVHRYFHEYRGGYASPEVLHEDVPVASVEASGDGRSLALRLERPHAAPRIYRLELRGLRDASGRKLATGEVYVTVHAVPGE